MPSAPVAITSSWTPGSPGAPGVITASYAPVAGVKASWTGKLALNPAEGDSILVGSQVYLFGSDFPLGDNAGETMVNLVARINAISPQVSASGGGADPMVFTALLSGAQGNEIPVIDSGLTWTGAVNAALSGGAGPGQPAGATGSWVSAPANVPPFITLPWTPDPAGSPLIITTSWAAGSPSSPAGVTSSWAAGSPSSPAGITAGWTPSTPSAPPIITT